MVIIEFNIIFLLYSKVLNLGILTFSAAIPLSAPKISDAFTCIVYVPFSCQTCDAVASSPDVKGPMHISPVSSPQSKQ